jgi:hypothetical protein
MAVGVDEERVERQPLGEAAEALVAELADEVAELRGGCE